MHASLVLYQVHVGHMEPIKTASKVQTLDQCFSPHTVLFTLGGNTKSYSSSASHQYYSSLGHAVDNLKTNSA